MATSWRWYSFTSREDLTSSSRHPFPRRRWRMSRAWCRSKYRRNGGIPRQGSRLASAPSNPRSVSSDTPRGNRDWARRPALISPLKPSLLSIVSWLRKPATGKKGPSPRVPDLGVGLPGCARIPFFSRKYYGRGLQTKRSDKTPSEWAIA